jgi:hypothetical protein
MLAFACRSDCTDCIRSENRNKHDEAQHCEAERKQACDFFHIGSYAVSILR